MKKIFSVLVVALCTTMVLNAAESVTDKLTYENFAATNNQYKDFADVTAESKSLGVVYAGQTAADKQSIQMRSKNANSGIVTTASQAVATQIVVTWHAETSDKRVLNIYGKATAYTAATDLYDADLQGEKIATCAKADGLTQTITLAGGYQYIGLCSSDGAVYLTNLDITWQAVDSDEPSITAPSVVDFGEVLIGSAIAEKTISIVANNYAETLVATLSEGAAYTVEGELTNEGGDLTIACTATEAGTHEATLTLSAGGKEVHAIALTAKILEPVTVEEFLANKDSVNYSYLVGKIKNIAMDKNDPTKVNAYGNFDLEDETGTIYVYGLLTADGEAKKFESLGLKEGDILTLKGKYTEYKGTPQVGSGRYVSHTTDSAVENVVSDKAKAVKIIENGQIYILKNGVRYNIFGAQVD